MKMSRSAFGGLVFHTMPRTRAKPCQSFRSRFGIPPGCQGPFWTESSQTPALTQACCLGPTVILSAWAHVDGADYPCSIQVDYGGAERILGRDVLNRMDGLFRGPAREVVINP